MPTIRDVAKMAGVSVSTVSLAFSSPHRLRPETLEKVHEAARTAGYVADPVARSLAGGSSRLIGMVVADVRNPFFGTLLSEVERRAAESGYLVIIADSNAEVGRERQPVMNHHRGAGPFFKGLPNELMSVDAFSRNRNEQFARLDCARIEREAGGFGLRQPLVQHVACA